MKPAVGCFPEYTLDVLLTCILHFLFNSAVLGAFWKAGKDTQGWFVHNWFLIISTI